MRARDSVKADWLGPGMRRHILDAFRAFQKFQSLTQVEFVKRASAVVWTAKSARGWLGAVAAALIIFPPVAATGQSKLEARYDVTLAGITIGKGGWIVEIAEDQYAVAASGRISGVMSALTNGQGAAASRGSLNGGRIQATTYAVNVTSDGKADEVRMSLKDGAVKMVTAEPPLPPHPHRVPVTEAHRRGVIDPISAGIVVLGGNGDLLVPQVCQRTISVFDGRQRYDLAFAFKRIDKVKAEKGYQGPVVVCSVAYQPMAGHRTDRAAVTFLSQSRDIEVWYAPVAGTRVLVPFRLSIPTLLGTAVLAANQFVTSPTPPRTAPASAKTQ